MRNFLAALLVLALLPDLVAAAHRPFLSFATPGELREFMRYRPGREPLVSAHRGGPAPGFPENCLESFARVVFHGPCLIEVDVRRTRDGRLVLMHDWSVDRTTTGSGRVEDLTLAGIRDFRLEDNDGRPTGFWAPTLEEALDWAADKAILELDVKQGVDPAHLLEIVRAHNASRFVLIITYELEQAQVYHRLDPEAVVCLSVLGVEGVEALRSSGIPAANVVAFVGVLEPDPGVYQELHGLGISTVLGTIGQLDADALTGGAHVYQALVERGADVLATDHPFRAMDALRARAGSPPVGSRPERRVGPGSTAGIPVPAGP